MSETGASLGGQPRRKFEGAGGTPGGFGDSSSALGWPASAFTYWPTTCTCRPHSATRAASARFGNSFGMSLLPLLFGIGTLFVNGKSTWAGF